LDKNLFESKAGILAFIIQSIRHIQRDSRENSSKLTDNLTVDSRWSDTRLNGSRRT
jgi:hypothetical protein